MYTLVFDTETTGLPTMKRFNVYHEPSLVNYYKNSRIIELAYIIYDEEGNCVKTESNLVKPNNFIIENSHIHGITQENAVENGKDIESVIQLMNNDLTNVDTIVAHNIDFDINILLSEC